MILIVDRYDLSPGVGIPSRHGWKAGIGLTDRWILSGFKDVDQGIMRIFGGWEGTMRSACQRPVCKGLAIDMVDDLLADSSPW